MVPFLQQVGAPSDIAPSPNVLDTPYGPLDFDFDDLAGLNGILGDGDCLVERIPAHPYASSSRSSHTAHSGQSAVSIPCSNDSHGENVLSPSYASADVHDLFGADVQPKCEPSSSAQLSLLESYIEIPAPALATATKSKTKPGPKRRKSRPKDKLELLQKQLDAVSSQFKELTLVNEQLHRKNKVLSTLLDCSQRLEALATQAQQQLDACCKDPQGQHPPVIVAVKNLTPSSFFEFYNTQLGLASKLVVNLDMTPNQADEQQLIVINSGIVEYLTHAFVLKPELMATVKEICIQQFEQKFASVLDVPYAPAHTSDRTSEQQVDDHMLSIVRMLELTPDQEQILLVAREVYLRCGERLDKERIGLGSAITYSTGDALNCSMYEANQQLLDRITATLFKQQHILMGFCCFLFGNILTPLQSAKCALHAHPLLPSPVFILNAVAAEVERRNQASAAMAPTTSFPLPPQHASTSTWHQGKHSGYAATVR